MYASVTIFLSASSFNYSGSFTSLTEMACSPLHANKLIWYVPLSDLSGPDVYAPSHGMIQGLKYDKNFADSWPCFSWYCTVQDPKAMSNSSALSETISESSCMRITMLVLIARKVYVPWEIIWSWTTLGVLTFLRPDRKWKKDPKPDSHPFQASNVHHVQAFHLSAISSVSSDRSKNQGNSNCKSATIKTWSYIFNAHNKS